MAFGALSTGFELKTVQDILGEIETEQLSAIAADLDVSAQTPLGQINGIVSSHLAEAWELLQTCYNAFNRDAAEGTLLVNLGALTGTIASAATYSVVKATMALDANKTVSAGSVANVAGQSTNRWVLQEDVVSTTAGNYTGIFVADTTGPRICNAGTLTVITAPVSGWNSVTNPLDAVPGHAQETDTAFRIRQDEELSATGAGTLDGMRADLLNLLGMVSVDILENQTMVTDSNGLPAKSFECVCFDGLTPAVDDGDIAQVIWDGKPSGIEMYGLTTGYAIDSQNNVRDVYFSRPTVKEYYVTIEVQTTELFPSDGVDQLKTALAAASLEMCRLAKSVRKVFLEAAVTKVAGVENMTYLKLGFSASPTGTSDLTVGAREIGHLDTAHIVVNLL